MPNIKVEPTIPNFPPQGIQAQLDLIYLWNPDVANDLIAQINKALEDLDKDLSMYLTKAEAAATYATQQDVNTLKAEVPNKVSKTGDTMTGALIFDLPQSSKAIQFSSNVFIATGVINDVVHLTVGDTRWGFYSNALTSSEDNKISLGLSSYRFATVYTYELNNGEDITVPTVGGTLTLNEVNFKTAITDTNKGLTEADAYTKEEVDAKITSVYRFRGSVATYNDLPTEGNVQGDVWNVEDTGANYAWTSTEWDKLSETVDLTPYLTKEDAASTYATITTVNGKQDALTPDQLAAVNSGITAEHVASYDAYAGEISAAQSTADKADGAAEVAQQTANLAGQEAAQALSALAGKVNIAQGADNVGKVMTVGEDGNLAPTAIPLWPSASDYLPVSTTLNANESNNYHLSCNLGALEDGVYEFYYRFIDSIQSPALPYPSVTGWQQWLVHLTIKDGEIFGLNSGTNNDSYCVPLPDTDNVGSANQPYASTGGTQLFCGKSGGNFYVEGAYNNAGFIYLANNETEQVTFTAAYVTKIKNINTGAFIAFADVALVDNTVANVVNQFINDVNPYNANVQNTIQQYFTTSNNSWSPLDEKYFSVYLGGTLTNRPLAPNNAIEINSFSKKATICFYTTPQSADYLEFDVYGSPTQVKITNVRKGGIFSDVVFANYYDTNDNYAGYLYLSKADGTNFQTTTDIYACASWYGQSWGIIRAESALEIPSNHAFIENLTPEDGAAITTDATLTGAGTTASPLGIAQSVQDSIDGKLPLAGGEFANGAVISLPGTLRVINETSPSQYYDITCEDGLELTFTDNNGYGLCWNMHAIHPWHKTTNPNMNLGTSVYGFDKAYITTINNGADIAIPTTGGTMALLSDIPSGVTTDSSLSGAGTTESPLQISSTVLGELETLNTTVNTLDGDVTDLGNQVTEIQSSVNTLNTTVEGMAATVSSNVITENLGNNIVRISGTETFGALAQQATTERPITLPVTLVDANYVVQTTATSAAGTCEVVSGFAARTTAGFNISVRNLAAAEATDVAVCWTIIGQKA